MVIAIGIFIAGFFAGREYLKYEMRQVIGGALNGMSESFGDGSFTDDSDLEPPIVTLDEYKSISVGMTYEQVVSIVGDSGKLTHEMINPNTKYPELDMHMQDYSWENGNRSFMSLTFDHGKVESKNMHRLK